MGQITDQTENSISSKKCEKSVLCDGDIYYLGVLLPNYLEENVVKGENVPNFRFNTSTSTTTGPSPSNFFQILQDLQLKQYQGKCHSDSMQSDLKTFHSTTNTFTENMAQLTTSFRTTTPSTAMTGRMTTKQVNPVQVPQDTSCKAHLEHWMHVHQPMSQVCKPGELLVLRKVKHPLNGRTSVSRLPLT